MLPDIGASELMVIALVALIFVGPKDLPLMLKKIGQFTAKMRRMAADFRTSFDDMARQSELEDLRREVEQMRATASQAVSDPAGVGSAMRETMSDMDTAMIDDTEPFDYDPGVPVDPEPLAEPEPAAPVKKTRVRNPATSDAAKPRKPARAKATTVEAGEPAAKPRRRASTKAAT